MKGFHSLLSSQFAIEREYGLQMAAIMYLIMTREITLSEDTFNLQAQKTTIYEYPSKVEGKKLDRVAVMTVNGPLFRDDQFCGPKGMLSMAKMLKEMDEDPTIDAIVMDVFSPGGQVPGVETLANTFANIQKPKILFGEMICSGAFYGFAGSDHIMLSGKNARVGSVGVEFSYMDFSKALEKEGIEVVRMVAETSPEKNSPDLRQISEENKKVFIKENLNPIDNHFTNHIRTFRPNAKEEALKGKVYYAEDAIRLGLADSIGTLEDAINMAIDQANKKKEESNNLSMKVEDKTLDKQEVTETTVQSQDDQPQVSDKNSAPTEDLQIMVNTLKTKLQRQKAINDMLHETVKMQKQRITDLTAEIDRLGKLPAADDEAGVSSKEDTTNTIQREKVVSEDPVAQEAMKVIKAARQDAGLKD